MPITLDNLISIIALVISVIAIAISINNQRREHHFDSKRFIINIWDKMANIPKILPVDGDYIEDDIFEALNTLELVAICWQNNIINKNMIYLVFGESYLLRIDEIENISDTLPKLNKTGSELLNNRQVIINVREDIRNMRRERHR